MYDNKNSCLYLIYSILREYSDSEHFLTWNQIVDLLDAKYGVEVDRKLVGRNIDLLIESDIDIVKGDRGKGFALIERLLDTSEIELILSTLENYPYISKTTLKHIVSDLTKDHSKFERKRLRKDFKVDNLPQYQSAEVAYTFSLFLESKKKKIRLEFNTASTKVKETEDRSFSLIPVDRILSDHRMLLTFKETEDSNNLFAFYIDEILDCKISTASIFDALDSNKNTQLKDENLFEHIVLKIHNSNNQ